MELKSFGKLDPKGYGQGYDVWDVEGICPTLISHWGGYGTLVFVDDGTKADRGLVAEGGKLPRIQGLRP